LGQNFLTDDRILADIVRAAKLKKSDLVMEVGPGTGNLTRHLVGTGAQITAVEKDDTLYLRLKDEFGEVS
jgi:16S rRNA (adenine1518-N6/adenine1519-N6)-dimethyltransferase